MFLDEGSLFFLMMETSAIVWKGEEGGKEHNVFQAVEAAHFIVNKQVHCQYSQMETEKLLQKGASYHRHNPTLGASQAGRQGIARAGVFAF